MTAEERREQAIQSLVRLLRTTPFKTEFVVKKKPTGIKIIIEMTHEQINKMMEMAARKEEQSQ